jgi:hypothetical protein
VKSIIAKLRERREAEAAYYEKKYRENAEKASSEAQKVAGYADGVALAGVSAVDCGGAYTDWVSYHVKQMQDAYRGLCLLKRDLDVLAEVERLYTEATPDADAVTVQDAAAQIIQLVEQTVRDLDRLPGYKKHEAERARLLGYLDGLLAALKALGFSDAQIAQMRGEV